MTLLFELHAVIKVPQHMLDSFYQELFVLLNFFSVFILDSGKHCFVWIGKGASPDEKRNGLSRAHVSASQQ